MKGMKGVTPQDTFRTPLIELSEVIAVDDRTYSITCKTISTNRTIPNLPIYTSSSSFQRGSGINVLPEVGDMAVVCFPSDSSEPFVFAFGQRRTGVVDEIKADYLNQRVPSLPGDVRVSTADGNFVNVLRGGVVEIGSTSTCQTIYIPIENTVREFFQRYQAYSPAGEIEWGYVTTEQGYIPAGSENDTPVVVRYSIKEKAQDRRATVELRVGRLDQTTLDSATDAEHLFMNQRVVDTYGQVNDTPSLVSLAVVPEIDDQPTVKMAFQVSRSGNIFLAADGGIHVEVRGTAQISADAGIKAVVGGASVTLDADGLVDLIADKVLAKISGSFLLRSPSVTVDAEGGTVSIDNASTVTVDGELISLGGATSPLDGVVTWSTLARYVQTELSVSTPMGPSGPAIKPPSLAAASSTVRAKS